MDWFAIRITWRFFFYSLHYKRLHTFTSDLHVVWGCTYPTRHSQVGHPSTPHLYPTSQDVGQLNDVTQSTLCWMTTSCVEYPVQSKNICIKINTTLNNERNNNYCKMIYRDIPVILYWKNKSKLYPFLIFYTCMDTSHFLYLYEHISEFITKTTDVNENGDLIILIKWLIFIIL